MSNTLTVDEMQAEADSGLPQFWIGTKYCEKCDLIGRQFCRCNSIPTLDPILLAPANLTVDDLTYWHRRAQDLLGQPVIMIRSGTGDI